MLKVFLRVKELNYILHTSLFNYIYVLMNRREIYFLCENEENEICLVYRKNRQCKHCRRLREYNLLFEQIERQKVLKTFKLVSLVDKIVGFLLKYKKYYILPELKDKVCNLCHYRPACVTVTFNYNDHLN